MPAPQSDRTSGPDSPAPPIRSGRPSPSDRSGRVRRLAGAMRRADERRWLLGMAALLGILTLGVMATALLGSSIQTGVRAYVGGEGLWSKAQKDAIVYLERYLVTDDERDWASYETELAVILGDRQARLELELPNPDEAVAAAGFVAGRNAPEDVPSMIMLFRTFRHLSYIDQAITTWTAGDAEIDSLRAIAARAKLAVDGGDTVAIAVLRDEIHASNARLTDLERDFSTTLGEGARWVASVLIIVLGAILALLVTITAIVGRWMLGRLRAADLRAAATLRASEARLRLLVDNLPAIVWTTTGDVVTSLTGDGLARLGVEPDGFIGRSIDALFAPFLDPGSDERAAAEAAHRAAFAGQAASYRATVADRVFQVTVEPLVVDGQTIGVIGLALDLTERLELEARLEQSTRLESIGRLAGGVAHDFNNLLTAITGYADLLTEGLSDEAQRHDAEEIRRAAQRAADLTAQLLAFGRRQVLKPEVVSPNDVIDEMRHMLGRLVGDDILVELDLDPALPSVVADPGQLEQVILNLAVNARDAMPAGGRLTIGTRRTLRSAAIETGATGGRTKVGAARRSARAAAITVADTGIGMDEATRARIFEPFFTTKARGKGTGLGLATVYGIVDQSGGSISVESTPGVGTTFTIVLAAAAGAGRVGAAASGTRPVAAAGRSAARGTEAPDGDLGETAAADETRPVILVAEDEPAVRQLVVHILEGAGYAAVSAAKGREALRVADRLPRLDALLTDVIMPHLNGPQLASAIRARRPELPVLFMSGFTGDVLGERALLDPDVELLDKPFLPETHKARIRALLEGAETSRPTSTAARPAARPDDRVA